MAWPREFRHVALCGWPKCGKSTVAELLEHEFNAVIIDDGLPLRRALPILTGIDGELPFTQDGKAARHRIGDREETVREGLGELGNYLEARYGDDIIPLLAMREAVLTHPDASFYVYPSVRKTQGRTYKRHGGLVIEVRNPLAGDSGNDFDRFDASCVDLVIDNDPRELTLDDLRQYVCELPTLLQARYG